MQNKLSVKQVADQLGLTKQAVMHRIKTGKLSAQKNAEGVWEVDLAARFDTKNIEANGEKEQAGLRDEPIPVSRAPEDPVNPAADRSRASGSKKVQMLIAGAGVCLLLTFIFVVFKFSQKVTNLENLVLNQMEHLGKEDKEKAPYQVQEKVTVNDENLLQAINKAADFLVSQKGVDSWGAHPGKASLCILALAKCPADVQRKVESSLSSGLKFIADQQGEDGAIANGKVAGLARNYSTALAILAFNEIDGQRYRQQVLRAKNYLVTQQNRSETSASGGLGYADGNRPDINNLRVALQAMKAAGVKKDDQFFQRALQFIKRCQGSEVNDVQSKHYHGGFYYSPELSRYDSSQSDVSVLTNGALTLGGVDSLLFCDVPATDPRFQQALAWIQKNYSVNENPGMGNVSLYYYYSLLSRVLDKLQLNEIETVKSGKVNWRNDLASQLLKKQLANGSWVNPQKKYMEGDPVVATAYGLLSLNSINEGVGL